MAGGEKVLGSTGGSWRWRCRLRSRSSRSYRGCIQSDPEDRRRRDEHRHHGRQQHRQLRLLHAQHVRHQRERDRAGVRTADRPASERRPWRRRSEAAVTAGDAEQPRREHPAVRDKSPRQRRFLPSTTTSASNTRRRRTPHASRQAFELSKAKIAEVAAAAAKNRPLSAEAREAAGRSPVLACEPNQAQCRRWSSSPLERTVRERRRDPGHRARQAVERLVSGEVPAGAWHNRGHGTGRLRRPDQGQQLRSAGSCSPRTSSCAKARSPASTRTGWSAALRSRRCRRRDSRSSRRSSSSIGRTGDKRLLAQQTDKLGVTLPIRARHLRGVGTTADGQTWRLATNLAVHGGQITKFDPLGQDGGDSMRARAERQRARHESGLVR